MSLNPGFRLGPYEILSAIGAGGMGEVYRARDTRLNRDVALKILPELFAADADRVARFKREAQLLASLNHPHIASVYGFEVTAGVNALVLELVDGPTLADRIAHGPISLDEALPIASQIAEALEAAHEHGIIHRDLKPANVKLTADGNVKVLDFGLAKALGPAEAGHYVQDAKAGHYDGTGSKEQDPAYAFSQSPTLSSPAMTRMGVILGTAAYMSPEQAKGKAIDKRTDVWAFGCVLYEMVTGKRAFDGEDMTETLAAIVRGEPSWAALPVDTPEAIHRLLRRALTKERSERLADISVARLEIKDALLPSGQPASARIGRPSVRAVLALAIVAISAIVGTIAVISRNTASPEPLWFSIVPPHASFDGPAPAISPDGRRVAFVASNQSGEHVLWIRSFTSPAAQEIAGTNGADVPFWSPDSRSLGFFAERKLKRVDIESGSPQILAEAPNPRGGTWSSEGVIVFAPFGGDTLYRVSAAEGPATRLTTLNMARGENEHGYPHFLPDGRHFLYNARTRDEASTGIHVASLDSKDPRLVATVRSRAEYADGYLFFGRDDSLFAQPFDLDSLALTGEPRRVADSMGMSFGNMMNYAFAVSQAGSLVTWSGWIRAVSQLTLLDRTGRHLADLGEPAGTNGFQVSPDQRYAATEVRDPKTNTVDIWLTDLSTGVGQRFTAGDRTWTGTPVWSPDGKRILFSEFVDEYQIKTVQGGQVERWPHGLQRRGGWPSGWSRDGRYLILMQNDPVTLWDIWLLTMSGDRKPSPYLSTRFSEQMPVVSPDSQWIAYESDEGGSREVYVNSFPRAGTSVRVSLRGGIHPVWRDDGTELYYIGPDQQLMAASIQITGRGISVSARRALFKAPRLDTRGSHRHIMRH